MKKTNTTKEELFPYEKCQFCGNLYKTVWECTSNKIWDEVTGKKDGSGLFCPKCFEEMARKKNIILNWKCGGLMMDDFFIFLKKKKNNK